jgi:hypothetical protein
VVALTVAVKDPSFVGLKASGLTALAKKFIRKVEQLVIHAHGWFQGTMLLLYTFCFWLTNGGFASDMHTMQL